MKYGLNDEVVKRIAAIAYHAGKGSNIHGHVSDVYHKLSSPDMIGAIANAHTTDAMQHKFSDKDAENKFKAYFAKSASINRGTLDPVPQPEG